MAVEVAAVDTVAVLLILLLLRAPVAVILNYIIPQSHPRKQR
jgi:hypothetical protein